MIRSWVLFLFLLPEIVNGQSLQTFGIIQDSLIAQSDSEELFALYLPEKEGNEQRAILFFEPVGRAHLPLQLYKRMAEKYGYTLICPYGSKNGDFQPTLKAAQAMLSELESMGYQTNQVYTSGFSGGARAASAIQKLYGLAGVIAVAGAWPPSEKYRPVAGDVLTYVAVVGDKDMNMVEHGQYQEYLTGLVVPNAIVYYPAGHQWPPASVYEQALAWTDRSSNGYELMIDFADSLLGVDQHLGYLQWQQWFRFPTQNFPEGKFEEKLAQLDADEDIRKLVANHEQARKYQVELRAKYDLALDQLRTDLFKKVHSEYDIPWWKMEVRQLRKSSDAEDQARALMADRIMDGLRGAIHVMIREATEYNQFGMAETLNKIMLLMYPQSVLYHFNEAIYSALQGANKKARKSLAVAQALDIDLLNQIRSNPAYNGMKSQVDYSYLFEPMK